jgi:hypothetical protein
MPLTAGNLVRLVGLYTVHVVLALYHFHVMATAGSPTGAGERLLWVIWSLTTVAFVTVILRTVAKVRLRQFRWDDVVVILAQVRN